MQASHCSSADIYWHICCNGKIVQYTGSLCMIHVHYLWFVVQEVEPSVGEKLCRLWASVAADSKGGGSSSDGSSWRSSHRDHSHSHPPPHTTFPPPMSSPYVHPHFSPMGLFDSRSVHMNPALYAAALPRYGSATPPFYWAATPPTRTVPSSSKRYSSRHKSTSKLTAEQNTTTTTPESQQ